MSETEVDPASRRPAADALIHLTPLISTGIGIAIAGQPLLWLVVLLPVGPLVLGALLAGRREAGRAHRATTIDFSFHAAALGLVLWLLIYIAVSTDGSFLLFLAVASIGVLLLAVNVVFLHAVGANDARKGLDFTYPWVRRLPTVLRGA